MPLPAPGLCGRCQHNPLSSGLCHAPLRYEGDARTLVHQLKYAHGLRAGIVLAEALVQQVRYQYQDDALPECLIPVPLSYPRQVQRGFNQAAWLAQRIGGSLGLQRHTIALRRRHGPPQQTLSRRARLGLRADTFNIRGALDYSHVAIIDDVLTTGATVSALSRALQNAGIAEVDIWVATRAAG